MAKRSKGNVLRDYGTTIFIAVTIALLVRLFVIEAYRIPTSAMKPSLESGDTVFVSKWPFGLYLSGFDVRLSRGRLPLRGEVVLFSAPGEPNRNYIKRVIGLAGDMILFSHGRVTLNGKPLALEIPGNSSCGRESLPDGKNYEICLEPPILEDFGPEKVPEDSIFVLGDLRSQGAATEGVKRRGWGHIPVSSLKGVALWIWLSIRPQTFGNTGWFPQFRFERMFRRIE